MTVVDAIGARYTVQGRASEADGRRGVVKAEGVIMEGKAVVSVTTIGQDGPTLAEQQKAATILQMLQDQSELLDNPFLRTIWPDGKEVVWPTLSASLSTEAPSLACSQPLNHSQRGAVEQMLSSTDASRITMVQGPPGTGKTTVIAAFVQTAVEAGKHGIWLMAQSNVAVKNIAEKLAKVQFENWRLLVSKDFHMDWLVFFICFVYISDCFSTGMSTSMARSLPRLFEVMNFVVLLHCRRCRTVKLFYAL